jgi:hypothetical protein
MTIERRIRRLEERLERDAATREPSLNERVLRFLRDHPGFRDKYGRLRRLACLARQAGDILKAQRAENEARDDVRALIRCEFGTDVADEFFGYSQGE